MKKLFTGIITFLVLVAVNWAASYFLSLGFFDLSILIGAVAIVVLKFFNSSGGMVSDSITMMTQSTTGVKQERVEKTFQPNVAFYVAVGYTVLALVGTFIYYMDYFV